MIGWRRRASGGDNRTKVQSWMRSGVTHPTPFPRPPDQSPHNVPSQTRTSSGYLGMYNSWGVMVGTGRKGGKRGLGVSFSNTLSPPLTHQCPPLSFPTLIMITLVCAFRWHMTCMGGAWYQSKINTNMVKSWYFSDQKGVQVKTLSTIVQKPFKKCFKLYPNTIQPPPTIKKNGKSAETEDRTQYLRLMRASLYRVSYFGTKILRSSGLRGSNTVPQDNLALIPFKIRFQLQSRALPSELSPEELL